MSLYSLLSYVARHPLNQGGRARALARVVRWQVASRLRAGPIAVPFVNHTRLLMTSGMTGATGNWYCGLHEHDDWFTSDLDAMNHALGPGEVADSKVEVPIVTLDGIAAAGSPTLIKIDVEGLETAVLAGGAATLRSDALRCVLIEMNGSGRRFGAGDAAIHAQMRAFGFSPARYDVLTRSITALPVDTWNRSGGNTLYVRDLEECRDRVRSAARFRLVNRDV